MEIIINKREKMEEKWKVKVNVRHASTNPLVRLLITLWAIVEFFIGIRRRGELKEFESKIEITTSDYAFWFYKKSEETTTISKSKINGTVVAYARSYIFFKVVTLTFYAGGFDGNTAYTLKGFSYKNTLEKVQEWL